jgi:hypothetical protein
MSIEKTCKEYVKRIRNSLHPELFAGLFAANHTIHYADPDDGYHSIVTNDRTDIENYAREFNEMFDAKWRTHFKGDAHVSGLTCAFQRHTHVDCHHKCEVAFSSMQYMQLVQEDHGEDDEFHGLRIREWRHVYDIRSFLQQWDDCHGDHLAHVAHAAKEEAKAARRDIKDEL